LASRDIGSFSDPYLKVTFGDQVKNLRDKYQVDESNPDFNEYFEFSGSFPGAPPVVIEVYDYDDLFGDDLIGKTTIDLDDRFFSGDWQALDEKPIEYRQIYHPSTSLS
jgi:Ca2+-dependent lipid-binding protein